jgi:hypothetical protein
VRYLLVSICACANQTATPVAVANHASAPLVAPLPPAICTVRTSLDKQFIRHSIEQHRGALSTCFDQFLERHPDQRDSFRVGSKFTIGSDGHVSSAEVSSFDAALGRCVCNEVERFAFPPLPPRAGSVQVFYPFVFTPPT